MKLIRVNVVLTFSLFTILNLTFVKYKFNIQNVLIVSEENSPSFVIYDFFLRL